MSMTPKVLAVAITAAAFALGGGALNAQQRPGFSPIDKTDQTKAKQDQNLKGNPQPATATPLEKISARPHQAAARLQGGNLVARPRRRTHHGDGREGHHVHGHAGDRPRLCDHRTGRQARGKVLLQGLTQPNGLAFHNGSLYVFAINRVLRYDNIEDKLDNPGEPVELTKAYDLPDTVHHNWKYVAFGPDGKMYVQVGANCNICEINPGIHGQIRRYNADGTGMEIVARGVRNTVGFDWHPVTKELWFTDNGRDWAGNDGPEDELNRVAAGQEGAFYGFPYCHANGIPDPDVRMPNACAGVVLPAALTGPHSAGLGIKFYTGTMFPENYRNVAFIARHGSWNREKRFGYDVVGRADRWRQGHDRTVHDRHARRGGKPAFTAGRATCSRWRTARCWCPTSCMARSTASPTAPPGRSSGR